jgi:hypothetical protein
MNKRIHELQARIRQLEQELEQEVRFQRKSVNGGLTPCRLLLARTGYDQRQRQRTGLIPYLRQVQWRHIVLLSLVYMPVIPLFLLDLVVSLYQLACAPLCRIPRVRRYDFFLYDRNDQAYLNVLEMLNCQYYAYATGLLAYVREVVVRTEQYWYTINHPASIALMHARSGQGIDYGDAAAYPGELDPACRPR